ncbi:MAG: cytochrome c5 family protein [Gammaproteobacteria bacterium AqS3]|nr:cytochrome c5 family protein [Gammaproteobacteria bacterium AqS3]
MPRLLPLCTAALIFLSALAPADGKTRQERIAENLAPYWSNCLTGEACAAPVVAARDGPARSGEAIYGAHCTTCHATGVAGAPMLGDVAAWAPRAATGMGELLRISISGIGGMPPKGTCMDCSDDEMRSAIRYMLDRSR